MGKEKQGFFSPRRVIDQYFLEEKNPYSKRRPFKMKTLIGVLGASLLVFVFFVIFFGGTQEKKDQAAAPDFRVPSATTVAPTNQALAIGQSPGSKGQDSRGSVSSGVYFASGGGAGGHSTQTHSANQVIRRGAGGNDPGSALPLGFGITVRLVNAILSTDSATPVIAEVTDDVYAHGSLSIPTGTRAIGSAQYDEASRRIQLRFQNFVYPEGDQHQVQAIGMMPDGSAGLDGDFHSGEAKRQVGRFLGHFISGLADGMKDRQAAGSFGMPYEPGSLKNGVLNGVTLSAQDQAKSYSEDLDHTKPFMTLQPGQSFVLFLEHEYVP
jgi:hypothetical protein